MKLFCIVQKIITMSGYKTNQMGQFYHWNIVEFTEWLIVLPKEFCWIKLMCFMGVIKTLLSFLIVIKVSREHNQIMYCK